MNDNKAAWQERIERQNAKHFETMIRHAKTVAVCPKCGLREINPSMHCPSCLYEAVPVINGCLAVVGKKGLRCQRTPIPRANSWVVAENAADEDCHTSDPQTSRPTGTAATRTASLRPARVTAPPWRCCVAVRWCAGRRPVITVPPLS